MSRDDELDEEIRAHLRMDAAERMARGASREGAERAARREFGNVTHVKEVTREMRGGLWRERLLNDVRYGVRALRRTPSFTVAAVLTLTLAIGANTAVFTVVNSVLLRPLPFPEPERLFLASYVPRDLPFEVPPGLADAHWLAYREHAHAFERITAYTRMRSTMTGAGDAATVSGARVDASFLPLLGVSPIIGRAFSREEEIAGRDAVAIISHRLWRERFGGDPGVSGRHIALDGIPYTIVGVMPAGFDFPAASDIWTPATVTLTPGNFFFMTVLGRLRDDVTPEQARAELDAVLRALPRDPWDRGRDNSRAAVVPLKDVITGKVAPSLWIFSGAVAFVLLIACANVANLLLIRAATRRRDVAVRVALGAGRMRIARQLLTESVLVGVGGGTLGIALAHVGVRTLLAIAPPGRIPRLNEVHVDLWVLGFTIALSIATGVIFGLVPALQSSRRPPADALAHSARTVGTPQGRLRGLLVAGEIALALVLLTGAGLMATSFARMRSVNKGYDGERVTRMAVDLTPVHYRRDRDRQRAFHARMIGELASIPGVRRAAGVSYTPMADVPDGGAVGKVTVEGPNSLPARYSVDKALVSPDYFATMSMRVLRGRDFSASDDTTAPPVAIVSESVARSAWPDTDAVGKRISLSDEPAADDWLTVVGVVNDIVQDRSLERRSTIYVPFRQNSFPRLDGTMTYVVRSDAAASVAPAMRAVLRRIDPTIPPQRIETMNEAMMGVLAEPLFQTRILAVFCAIALLLAAIGTYGVMAYDVTERSREIALRMALGATPAAVTRLVLRRSGVLALAGAIAGVLGSLAMTGVLTKSLYGVKPNDPATLAIAAIGMLLVAVAAGYLPARRAARVEVLTELAQE